MSAVEKFKKELETCARTMIEKIQEVVEKKKKKTIQPQDIEDALENTEV
jgi:histone H3/H4